MLRIFFLLIFFLCCKVVFAQMNEEFFMQESTTNIKAAIFGIEGTTLSESERSFFKTTNPLGFILFKRNIESTSQIRSLIADLKTTLSHDVAIFSVDQEGGRVARLRGLDDLNLSYPLSAQTFGNIYHRDQNAAKRAAYLHSYLIGLDLQNLGFNVDYAPVVDVPVDGAHIVIGDRAFSKDPQTIAALAKESAQGFFDASVVPVMKHIPGHGRAMKDSHFDCPVVTEETNVLDNSDFYPFKQLKNTVPFAMTAHIVYTMLDKDNPATFSKTVVDFIRQKIGFDGLLISDDLNMKALEGTLDQKTKKTFDAGCDIALHCSGKLDEMMLVAQNTPHLSLAQKEKVSSALSFNHKTLTPISAQDALLELNAILEPLAIKAA